MNRVVRGFKNTAFPAERIEPCLQFSRIEISVFVPVEIGLFLFYYFHPTQSAYGGADI